MICIRKLLLVFALFTFNSMNVIGADIAVQEDSGMRQSPPPEAYTACEGKTVGETVQVTGPNGGTVSGTCEEDGDRLFLRPDRPKGRGGSMRQSPPPEAYAACEGKTVGDAAQVTGPKGRTVSGTCEEDGDRLFLRPDRPKGRGGSMRQSPPPEAYAACEGKTVGETVQVTGPNGRTVSGTCEEDGDRLFLRPDSFK